MIALPNIALAVRQPNKHGTNYAALFGRDGSWHGSGVNGVGEWRWLTENEKSAFRRYVRSQSKRGRR
jgi:hypothetical protein